MIIAGLTSTEQTTVIETFAANDLRALIANPPAGTDHQVIELGTIRQQVRQGL